MRVVLASASPRRRDLLDQLEVTFDVIPADIDESARAGEDPRAYVHRLAIEKAAAVVSVLSAGGGVVDGTVVIAADTTVDLDGQILGKPVDEADARAMLRSLSARTHRVHTGVAVHHDGRVASEVNTTMVTFTPVTDAALEWYLTTGEPFDKAGAYGMQGAGGLFVDSVRGSVSNVIGLPLATVVRLAGSIGVQLVHR